MTKYHYYTGTTKEGIKQVICVSSYAGQKVRGIAKCSPADTYNEEYGKELARLRCDIKVATLKTRYANSRKAIALDYFNYITQEMGRMTEFVNDAESQLDTCKKALEEFNNRNI